MQQESSKKRKANSTAWFPAASIVKVTYIYIWIPIQSRAHASPNGQLVTGVWLQQGGACVNSPLLSVHISAVEWGKETTVHLILSDILPGVCRMYPSTLSGVQYHPSSLITTWSLRSIALGVAFAWEEKAWMPQSLVWRTTYGALQRLSAALMNILRKQISSFWITFHLIELSESLRWVCDL